MDLICLVQSGLLITWYINARSGTFTPRGGEPSSSRQTSCRRVAKRTHTDSSKILTVHIFVLIPLFYSVNALRGVVDWQGVYKHYFPIYRLMKQLSLEIENFNNFPEAGIYVRCAVGRKLMISLVGGRDRHWSFLNMIVGHFFLIPRIFRNREVGILYEIRWSNDVPKLASLCLKNILSSDIKNGISRLLYSPLAFH